MLLINLFPSQIIPERKSKIVVLIKILEFNFNRLEQNAIATYTCLTKNN
ncbi:hypothetical protein SXM_1046 [Shewanella xiamenensis]|nr:hypothetical protein SXM_1046 [Shewanella xiamenensis]